MERRLIGYVAVDSASVVIADPSAFRTWDASRRPGDTQELCQKAGAKDLNDMYNHHAPELPLSESAAWVAMACEERGAVLGPQFERHVGQAVAISTGLGDGLYPVYIDIVEDTDVVDAEMRQFMRGRVARIIVDCQLVDEDD